jgi:hypothetical protein
LFSHQNALGFDGLAILDAWSKSRFPRGKQRSAVAVFGC